MQLPIDKHDVTAANALLDVSPEMLRPHIASLLEWLQDYNWPVAKPIAEVLTTCGISLVEPIRQILQGEDDIWKYWMIQQVIPLLSSEAQLALHHEIVRISEPPTQGEITEEVALEAEEYLAKKRYEEK